MKITRMLSLMLCLVLLCSTMLGTVAFAADPMDDALVEEAITADATMAIQQDPDAYIMFTTMDDLKELASKKYDTLTHANCPYPLEITESITIPQNLEIYADELTVGKDATVVVNGLLGARLFTIHGSVVNNELLYTNERMEITGHVQNNASFNIFYIGNDVELIGEENISHAQDCALIWQCRLSAGIMLERAVESAAQHPDWVHFIYTDGDASYLHLENSVTVPGNVQINLMSPTTIEMAPGCTLNIESMYVFAEKALTLNGDVSIAHNGMLSLIGPGTIQGDLTNAGVLSVFTDMGGKVTLEGAYNEKNDGAILVLADDMSDLSGAITGLKLQDFAFATETVEGEPVFVLGDYFDSDVELQPGQTVPMFRMYDPNSSEHFYTGSTQERYDLLNAGWNYEGVGFNFPAAGDPVYRLYHEPTGEHLYTMDTAEMDALLADGWMKEGVAFNSATTSEVPQYRLHNPNATRGAYHFTGSEEEKQDLLKVGWEDQGIGWYSCLK